MTREVPRRRGGAGSRRVCTRLRQGIVGGQIRTAGCLEARARPSPIGPRSTIRCRATLGAGIRQRCSFPCAGGQASVISAPPGRTSGHHRKGDRLSKTSAAQAVVVWKRALLDDCDNIACSSQTATADVAQGHQPVRPVDLETGSRPLVQTVGASAARQAVMSVDWTSAIIVVASRGFQTKQRNFSSLILSPPIGARLAGV